MVVTAITFVLAALVRFWMQAFRAPARNPIAQFSMALTDFAVKPLRRLIPGFMIQRNVQRIQFHDPLDVACRPFRTGCAGSVEAIFAQVELDSTSVL